ncbi:MAG: response regulator transcription factor [Nitrospirota bacterium]
MTIRVFIADDHAVVRDGLKLLLEAHGDIVVVGEAADGRQTVRMVKQSRPDIVLMDVAMPKLNGIDAARQILECCPSIKVVVLSMHASNEYVYQALKAGARGYLLKESAGKEVVNAVRTVYSGRRYLSQQITETVLEGYMQKAGAMSSRSPVERLSTREREILQCIVDGRSNAEIAKHLSLSIKTVETYKSRLMAKLNIHDLPALVKFAIRHGLTTVK